MCHVTRIFVCNSFINSVTFFFYLFYYFIQTFSVRCANPWISGEILYKKKSAHWKNYCNQFLKYFSLLLTFCLLNNEKFRFCSWKSVCSIAFGVVGIAAVVVAGTNNLSFWNWNVVVVDAILRVMHTINFLLTELFVSNWIDNFEFSILIRFFPVFIFPVFDFLIYFIEKKKRQHYF